MTIDQFCVQYGCVRNDIEEFIQLANRHKRCEERSINGDPFPGVNSNDKNFHSLKWDRICGEVQDKMVALAKQMGFKGITWAGLWPTLSDGTNKFIELPTP